MISTQTRRTAGLIFLLYPLVALLGYGLGEWVLPDAGAHPEANRMLRAGYAHAGVVLCISLAMLLFVDVALLSDRARAWVRTSGPVAALLLTAGFYATGLRVQAGGDGVGWFTLVYLGALVLATGATLLGVGLVRR